MPKAKKSSKRKKFDYNQDRKKMRKRSNKKYNPRIENSQIRNAWDNKKSTAKNLQEMGLAFDPNRTVPIKKSSLLGPDKPTKAPTGIVTKPYVLNQLQKEANVPERDCKTLSSDLIEYAQYMIREHNDDFKVRAAAGPEGGFWSFLGEVPRSDGVSTFALKSHSVHNGGNCVHVVLWATKYPTIKRFPPLLKV
uniref:Nucleolar protein 16 n=1 Tax=Gasterosteus aculeatus aculeatus TaxID=481459 RepID=A0AAQ4NP51_GASAC